MKRLMVIAAAVLVPFAALVWWGLAALHEPVTPLPPVAPAEVAIESPGLPSPPRAPSPHAAPTPVPVPAPTPAPAEVAAAVAPEPPAADDEEPSGPHLPEAKARNAVIHQLTPVVQTCFLEMNDRLKQRIRVAAVFETNADGSVTNVRVKMKSADPYLVACVQDALEGARLDPKRGLPSGMVRHTFAFNPEGAK